MMLVEALLGLCIGLFVGLPISLYIRIKLYDIRLTEHEIMCRNYREFMAFKKEHGLYPYL